MITNRLLPASRPVAIFLLAAIGVWIVARGVEKRFRVVPAAAAIKTDSLSHNFGVCLDRTATLIHTFVIENPTDRTVTVKKVAASCACLSADLDNYTLARGDVAHLRVTLQAALAGDRANSVVIVKYDDDSQSYFRVVAEVRSNAAFVPNNFQFKESPIKFRAYKTLPQGVNTKIHLSYIAESGHKVNCEILNQHWVLLNTENSMCRYYADVVAEFKGLGDQAQMLTIAFDDGETVVREVRLAEQ